MVSHMHKIMLLRNRYSQVSLTLGIMEGSRDHLNQLEVYLVPIVCLSTSHPGIPRETWGRNRKKIESIKNVSLTFLSEAWNPSTALPFSQSLG